MTKGIGAYILRFFDSVAAFAVPRTCPVCGRSLNNGEGPMCLHCLMGLPRTDFHLSPNPDMILDRLPGMPVPKHVASWFYYNRFSAYAELVRHAKYHDCPGLAREAGKAFATETAAEGAFEDVDVLLPVPMHWFKQLRRGYNQSVEIAAGISDATGTPIGDNLRAARSHKTQTRRSFEMRRRNVAGTFVVENPEEIAGLNVGIVDDVITSGATMCEAMRALLQCPTPPASISIYSLAIANR